MTSARRFLVIGICALAVGGLAALVYFLGRGPETAWEPVRVGHLPIIASLPLFVAEEKGFFREEGVEVQLVQFQDSNKLSDALAMGELDVAPTVALVPMVNLESRFPGRIRVFSVSKMSAAQPFDSIVVLETSPIRALGDLAGKRVGAFPGTTPSAALRYFLSQQGVNPDSVTIAPLPPPMQVQALESGSVDALFAYEHVLTAALLRGCRRVHGSIYASFYDPAPIGCSALSRRWESEHPDEVRRFLRAFDRAVAFIRTQPAEARETLERRVGIQRAVAQRCSLLDLTLSSEDPLPSLRAYQRPLVEMGEMPAGFDISRLLR